MRKITYDKLTIQNFLSVGNDILEIFFQNGLNLITGKNLDNPERVNGIGKSVIIEAYYYALFGTTIRDIKKDFCVNNVTKGSGRIELFFTVQTDIGINSYKIVRQLKPSTVNLYKLGDKEEDISKDSIANTNKYINDLIGSNPIISKSCDILSLSDNVPFMAKKPEEKRKFIEDIFSLEIFGKMLKELKEQIKENKADLSVSLAKKEEIGNSIEVLNKQYESQKKQIEEREEILKRRREELEEKITETKNSIDEISIIDVSPINENIRKLNDAMNLTISQINSLGIRSSHSTLIVQSKQSEIKKLEDVDPNVKCEKCLQTIPHNHIQQLQQIICDLIKDIDTNKLELENIETENINLSEKKTKIFKKIRELEDTVLENVKNSQRKQSFEIILSQYEKSLTELDEDIKDIYGSLSSIEESIQNTIKRKEGEVERYNELKQNSEDLETCKFILGEEGVKSFIIKRLLDMLNSSIQKYINNLGMNMRCKFDEYFEEKITNEKGKDISYWNFSGGERRTVDIACAWAFKDIKKKISGISSNVEFLDEILDSCFDERGVDILIEILKDRITANNLSCYAISHRKETLKHISGEILNIQKLNGITSRVL